MPFIVDEYALFKKLFLGCYWAILRGNDWQVITHQMSRTSFYDMDSVGAINHEGVQAQQFI